MNRRDEIDLMMELGKFFAGKGISIPKAIELMKAMIRSLEEYLE